MSHSTSLTDLKTLYSLFPPEALISAEVVDLKTSQKLISINSQTSMVPASCMKLITTAAALEILGPDSCFHTYLEYDGNIDSKGTLHGNLYIRGGGDPCLGFNRVESSLSAEQLIETWTAAVVKAGIRSIDGRILADDSLWEKDLAVPSWQWEDIGNYYGVGASALSFHENFYSLVFQPGKSVGDPASLIRKEGMPNELILKNEVKTGESGSGDRTTVFGMEYVLIQFAKGTIPIDVPEFTIRAAIPDPATYCADLLTRALVSKGVMLHHKGIAPSQRHLLHHLSSPTVKEIVYWTNQKSINLYAEHLLKKMGEKVLGRGSTRAGVEVVTAFLKQKNIDLQGFHMVDGSGLSRKNLVTAEQLTALLGYMKTFPCFTAFLASLPTKEGVKAKSGSMSLIKGYAGYKENIAFSILINHCQDVGQMDESITLFLKHL